MSGKAKGIWGRFSKRGKGQDQMTIVAGGADFAPSADVNEDPAVGAAPELHDAEPPAIEQQNEEADRELPEKPREAVPAADGDLSNPSEKVAAEKPKIKKGGDGLKAASTRPRKSMTSLKAPKLGMKIKATNSKRSPSEEELSLPVNVSVDFFRGVTRHRDAEQIARAFVEKNFDSPNASYIYVQKWRDGYVVECQEGGGRAYLPEVLAKLDEDETSLVALPMSGRVLQVRLDLDTKALEALVLTAGQLPSEGAFIAYPSTIMSPMDKRGSNVFIAGMGLLAASLIALVFSIGAFFIDTNAWALPYIQQTRVQDLPSAQTNEVQAVLNSAGCVAKMEFSGGNWVILPGWDDGTGVCSSVARPPAPEENVFPEEIGSGVDAPLSSNDPSQVVQIPGADMPSAPQP